MRDQSSPAVSVVQISCKVFCKDFALKVRIVLADVILARIDDKHMKVTD